MAGPSREERRAQVRRNWRWYAGFFALVLALGLWRMNWAAILGAGIGFGWLGLLMREKRE